MAFNFVNAKLSQLAATFVDLYTPSAVKSFVMTGTFVNRSGSTAKAYVTRQRGSALTLTSGQVWQVDDTPSDNAFVDMTTEAEDATNNNWILFTATEATGRPR